MNTDDKEELARQSFRFDGELSDAWLRILMCDVEVLGIERRGGYGYVEFRSSDEDSRELRRKVEFWHKAWRDADYKRLMRVLEMKRKARLKAYENHPPGIPAISTRRTPNGTVTVYGRCVWDDDGKSHFIWPDEETHQPASG